MVEIVAHSLFANKWKTRRTSFAYNNLELDITLSTMNAIIKIKSTTLIYVKICVICTHKDTAFEHLIEYGRD